MAWINREWKIEEDKGAVDESAARTKEVTVIEELIKTLEPPYYKELRAELGLTAISFGEDCEDKRDEDFLGDFSENNPFE